MHVRKSKFFIIVAAFTIIMLVFPYAYAASEYESDKNIVAGLIGTAGTGNTFEISFSRLFQSEEDFGQDIYMAVYKRTKYEPADLAMKKILADGSVSQEEFLQMTAGANLRTLVKESAPGVAPSPQEVEDRRLEMQRFAAEEKQLADLESAAQMETMPTEIFANGDESDSGFDLLADLDIIEVILFGKVEASYGNAGAGAPAGSKLIDLAGGDEAAGEEAIMVQPQGGPQGRGGAGAGGAGANAASLEAGAVAAEPSPEEAAILCPVNQSFNDAVVEARSRERAAGGADGRGGAGRSGAGGAGAGGRGGAGGAGAPEGAEAEGGEGAELAPAQPADWSNPLPCNKYFCIKFEAVYRTDSSYPANASCIACHFEKINDKLRKTLSHNLVPSKATGNLFEGPKCKSNMFNLTQHIILIPKPIMTPPNDDLVVKGDFIKNWFEFTGKYYGNPGRCNNVKKGDKEKGCASDPAPAHDAAADALAKAPPGTTPRDIISEINAEVAAKRQEALKEIQKNSIERSVEGQVSQFEVVMQEMDAMNAYFSSFAEVYNNIAGAGGGDSPCQVFARKEQCP